MSSFWIARAAGVPFSHAWAEKDARIALEALLIGPLAVTMPAWRRLRNPQQQRLMARAYAA